MYSSRPASPNSRPKPERFHPPKGVPGHTSCEQLIQTVPASSASATRSARAASAVITACASPNCESLANATASRSVPNVASASTGPKISSHHAAESKGTSAKMVGATYQPPSQPGTLSVPPPHSTRAPSMRALAMESRTVAWRSAEMRAPICVSSSSGSPTTMALAAATRRAVNSAAMGACSSSLDVAEQTCPALPKMPSSAHSTAESMSASSKTIIAPLPPSSSEVGRSARALWWRASVPARALPVRLTLSTRDSGESSRLAPSAAPEGGPPVMTESAPVGAPTAAAIRPSSRQVSEASGEGLSSTAQPAARAGATFTQACISG
mmetsp:Transcript_9/g.17  ORF Transcript_9/g.17 Transcript_9/m.17 type:complete len:325 (+) Transcript_9:171-1145(+)